ncbi:YqzK family protein [Sporolactobacillus shoreicorticis]|uniref:DUF4227 family protein n=1 Tax=Sporolactobacillus shoreicorticis TaxID=1923877 RepID=A0ABW5S2V2_9BACL|nr:DUF4227 family protein [Sporolactobacillus shoreicorticis]MCO7126769.1 YqzK family protein [Sporolactobacillus shoreicorticis]
MNTIYHVGVKCFKIGCLFALLTAAFYFGMMWMDHFLDQAHRYDEPGSGAVAVIRHTQSENIKVKNSPDFSRFFDFLRDGE